ncbi:hypothetical protein P2318_25780 [Myxococcaceae bacterium GXIMD 01537]
MKRALLGLALALLPVGAAAQEEFQSSTSPTVKVTGGLRLRVGVDTHFDAPREDGLSEQVVDARGRAALGTDVKLSSSLRLLMEGRAQWRAGAVRGFERGKATFEPSLGEAFLDVYTRHVDVRVGQQTLAFGANAVFAPTDVLNPRDLREGLVLAEPEDAKLPVFAARALATVGPLSVSAAWVPFFQPHRYAVFGQDEALLQPALGLGIPLPVTASVENELQPHLLETERPQFGGDVGVRLTTEVDGVRVGASWVWMSEKLPQMRLEPELEALLRARERGEPADTALLLSVQERVQAGEALATGRYARQHVLGLEASALVGPAQLDVDVGFSPAQTFVDERLRPLRKVAVTWVLGLSQAEESRFVYALTYQGLAVPGVAADELLVLMEPGTARGAARTAFLHLLVADVRYALLDEALEVGLRGAFEPVQRSFVLAPRVEYRVQEKVRVGLAAEVYAGPPHSPLGYFGRNDQVLASVRLVL